MRKNGGIRERGMRIEGMSVRGEWGKKRKMMMIRSRKGWYRVVCSWGMEGGMKGVLWKG